MHKKQKEITIFDIRQHEEPKPRLLGGSGFRKKVWLRLRHTENNILKHGYTKFETPVPVRSLKLHTVQ